jgi:hypothetical protein
VLPHHRPDDVVRIRTPEWCRSRLGPVTDGLLNGCQERRPRPPLSVACVADQADVVFVVRDQPEQTWSLVWTTVTIEVSGTSPDGLLWVVQARGTCERERLPSWAAVSWARSSHPAFGRPPDKAPPPFGLRLRGAGLRGYSACGDGADG